MSFPLPKAKLSLYFVVCFVPQETRALGGGVGGLLDFNLEVFFKIVNALGTKGLDAVVNYLGKPSRFVSAVYKSKKK